MWKTIKNMFGYLFHEDYIPYTTLGILIAGMTVMVLWSNSIEEKTERQNENKFNNCIKMTEEAYVTTVAFCNDSECHKKVSGILAEGLKNCHLMRK